MKASEQTLHDAARSAFEKAFGRAPEIVTSAPGRINLLGEHTDYNEGFVLPTALPLRTCVALATRDDRSVHVGTEALGGTTASFELGTEHRERLWIDYLQGVTLAAREHGHVLRGFEAMITSQIPLGGGLSSSAALSVALLRALRAVFGWTLDDLALARLAQWGENHVVGAPVGIMDPLACHLGDERTALFIDTRTLDYERVPLPRDAELLVADTGIRHSHATGSYRKRREECEAAAAALGVRSLRDVSQEMRPNVARLPEPLNRRAKHVLAENERVLRAVQALRDDNPAVLGALLVASHVSLRDDFEASVPEADRIVEAAMSLSAVYGARLTGGGFGGAVMCLVQKGRSERVAQALAPCSAGVLLCADPR